MGAKVDCDGDTETVTGTKDNTIVILAIGSTSPTKNGKVVTIDQPSVIVNDRTLAPLRFVAEAFGGVVDWDDSTQTANITMSDTATTTPPATTTPEATPSVTTPPSGSNQWTGTWGEISRVDIGTMILSQNGNTVTGTFSSDQAYTVGTNGTISGTVSGNELSAVFTYIDGTILYKPGETRDLKLVLSNNNNTEVTVKTGTRTNITIEFKTGTDEDGEYILIPIVNTDNSDIYFPLSSGDEFYKTLAMSYDPMR